MQPEGVHQPASANKLGVMRGNRLERTKIDLPPTAVPMFRQESWLMTLSPT